MSQLRLLIDTDIGTDDAVALVMALRTPSVTVEAITTVGGNTTPAQCVRNARYVLELCHQDAPVYQGSDRPLVRPPRVAAAAHGDDGLGGLGLRPHIADQTPGVAAEALVEIVERSPGQLVLVTLAPLTNVALALRLAPSMAANLVRVVVMGGAASGIGNVTPSAEFNIWSDPEAARIVFDSGLAITMVGIELSRGDNAHGPADIEYLARLDTPYSQFVTVMCRAAAGRIVRNQHPGLAGLPDAVAMAVALDPSVVVRSERYFVDVETRGRLTVGQTVVDRLGMLGRPANVEIVEAIDVQRYKRMVRDACR